MSGFLTSGLDNWMAVEYQTCLLFRSALCNSFGWSLKQGVKVGNKGQGIGGYGGEGGV